MPQGPWSAKRDRQYEDIRSSLLSRGRGEKLAEDAKKAGLAGRSAMTKARLERALTR